MPTTVACRSLYPLILGNSITLNGHGKPTVSHLHTVHARGGRTETADPADKLARQYVIEAHGAIEASRCYSVREGHLVNHPVRSSAGRRRYVGCWGSVNVRYRKLQERGLSGVLASTNTEDLIYLLDVVHPGRLHRFDGPIHRCRADPAPVAFHFPTFPPLSKTERGGEVWL